MFCEMEGFINGQQFKKLYEKKYEPLMKKYDLRKIELDVLFFLYSYERYNTARDIATYKCLSKAHVSKAIENLTSRSFISARPGEGDRRQMHLSTTAQAEPILSEIKEVWDHLEVHIYQDISGREREVFMEVLNKIMRNVNLILGDK